MTKLLEQAFAVASALPEDKQNDFAQRALEELEGDQKWDALFADPRSATLLEQLAAEALLEIERGETEDFDAVLDAHEEASTGPIPELRSAKDDFMAIHRKVEELNARNEVFNH